MPRLGSSLAALALAAGAFVAGTLAAASPASAGNRAGYDLVLVEALTGQEIPVVANISPGLAANLCGIDAAAITRLRDHEDRASCPSQGPAIKVKKHH